MKVTIVQFDIKKRDTQHNLRKIENLIEHTDQDLIVLPEMFTCGFFADTYKMAMSNPTIVTEWMRDIAYQHKCSICGSIPLTIEGKTFNRLYFVESDGSIHTYDKRHLFSMGTESEHFSAGDKRLVVDVKDTKIMPLICYDLRFPVWSRNNDTQYDIAIYVANWPSSRSDAWTTLLKARAIENQCYVIGSNRVGTTEDGIKYSGNSIIFGPKGEVLAETEPDNECTLSAEVNIDSLHKFRNKFKVLADADNFVIK